MSVLSSDCDRALAAGATPAHAEPPAHPNLVLCTSILASSLAFIDGSVVNVGLSAIGQDLASRGADLSWVVNGYLLPLSSLLLLGGALGDHYGRKRMLVIGTAVFALAALLCALVPRLSLLVAGRVLQGVGAALVLPNSLAILSATERLRQPNVRQRRRSHQHERGDNVKHVIKLFMNILKLNSMTLACSASQFNREVRAD